MTPRLRSWLGPLLFGGVVYASVASFEAFASGYHGHVAGYANAAAATITLFLLLAGDSVRIDGKLLCLGALVALTAWVSTVASPSTFASTNRLYFYYGLVLFGVGLYLLQRNFIEGAVARYFTVVAVLHVHFLVFTTFWMIDAGAEAVTSHPPHYGNIRHFAYHSFLAASCGTALFQIQPRWRVVAFLLTSSSLFGIIASGSRGAFAAWVSSSIFISLFARRRVHFGFFCAAALALSAFVVGYLDAEGVLRLPSLFKRAAMGVDSALYVSDRVGIWRDALGAILERPWFGYGPDGFLISRCCRGSVAQPHNSLLQFSLEFGLIGIATMAVLVYYLGGTLGGLDLIRRNLGRDYELLGLCGIIIAFLLYSLIDGLLYHAVPLIHFSLFLALLAARMRALRFGPGAVRPGI